MPEHPPPNVVVLDRTDALVRNLARAVIDLDHTIDIEVFTSAPQVAALFDEEHIDVLVLGPSEMTPTGLRRVAAWHAAHPATMVMVAAEPAALPDPALLIKAGVEQFLKLPAGPAAVRRALDSAVDVSLRRRAELGLVFVTDDEVEEAEPAPELELVPDPEPEPEPEPEPAGPGLTITIASATGGCGKTFLATNLAYLLAHGTGKRVAVIDLDLQFGEVVAALQLKPTHCITDVVVDEDGTVDITGLMTSHSGGFDVLAAPSDPVAADGIGAAMVSAVIEAVRQSYDFVLIDTPPSLNEVVLASFDVSDQLIVLATLDVPSIRNMRVFLTTLERLRIPQDGLQLVLNKAERGVEFSAADVRQVLGRSWDLELPYDRQVSRAVNLGLPVSEAAPDCQVSRRLVAGVSTIVPGADVEFALAPSEHRLLHRILAVLRPSGSTPSAHEGAS